MTERDLDCVIVGGGPIPDDTAHQANLIRCCRAPSDVVLAIERLRPNPYPACGPRVVSLRPET